MTTIGIMGCGWLGFPLAKTLQQVEGYQIKGTTTSDSKRDTLERERIQAYTITIATEGIAGNIQGFLADVDVLILNVPPRLRGANPESYIQKMDHLYRAIKVAQIKKILFVSSTSVYGVIDGEVTEQTIPQPNTRSGEELLVVENTFKNDPDLQTTIVRFGGLIGPDRNPVTMLVKRKGLTNGGAPVNLIHLNDCVAIIKTILSNHYWGALFNAVYPDHPTKKEYYTNEALKLKLPPPDYEETVVRSGKIIRSEALIKQEKYRFTTPIS